MGQVWLRNFDTPLGITILVTDWNLATADFR